MTTRTVTATETTARRRTRRSLAFGVTGLLLASCGGDDTTADDAEVTAEVAAPPVVPAPAQSAADDDAATGASTARLELLGASVDEWRDASSIEEAHAAAEAAANLVVGPNGPGYGDRDGDGTVDGESDVGLLPGLDGTPTGLASVLASNECIERDVLGGSWDDPGARWDTMLATIDAWRPDDNTMPSLPSHPMRVVGWATFTLATDDLDDAHEYAGHARLHVDVSTDALAC